MTIYQQTLKTLEAQFKTATDAVVAQFKAATEAVLLAQEAAYNVKNDELDIYKGDKKEKLDNKPEPAACNTVAASSSPLPFYAPGIDSSIPVPCTAVPLPMVKASPPPFIAPPPGPEMYCTSFSVDGAGHVLTTWAPGPAPISPPLDLTALLPKPLPAKSPPPSAPATSTATSRSRTSPPPAPGLPVGASAAPWTPPPPIAWEWPTLPPKGTPAPVFVLGQPPVTVEKEDDEVEDVLQPSDVNDAWYPEAGQTWDDEPEPVDLPSEVRLPGPPAPPRPALVEQATPAAPAKLGDPSRDLNRKAARFVPDTASRRSNRVSRLTDGGEPKLASVRSAELREAARSDLKALLYIVYVGPNGRPLMNYDDVIDMDTDVMVSAILGHEVAKGWVTGEHGAVN